MSNLGIMFRTFKIFQTIDLDESSEIVPVIHTAMLSNTTTQTPSIFRRMRFQ